MKRNSSSLIRALAYVVIELIRQIQASVRLFQRMCEPCVIAYPQHHLVAQCQRCGVMTSISSPMKTRTEKVAWELFDNAQYCFVVVYGVVVTYYYVFFLYSCYHNILHTCLNVKGFHIESHFCCYFLYCARKKYNIYDLMRQTNRQTR